MCVCGGGGGGGGKPQTEQKTRPGNEATWISHAKKHVTVIDCTTSMPAMIHL